MNFSTRNKHPLRPAHLREVSPKRSRLSAFLITSDPVLQTSLSNRNYFFFKTRELEETTGNNLITTKHRPSSKIKTCNIQKVQAIWRINKSQVLKEAGLCSSQVSQLLQDWPAQFKAFHRVNKWQIILLTTKMRLAVQNEENHHPTCQDLTLGANPLKINIWSRNKLKYLKKIRKLQTSLKW